MPGSVKLPAYDSVWPRTALVGPVMATFCGATLLTVTSIAAAVEAVELFDCSVAVAVTVRVNGASPGRLSGSVRVRPASCAGVSVHVPSPLSVPADRMPPAGTPATVIDE